MFFVFFYRTWIDEDVVHVHMGDLADAVIKNGCHQALKCWGRVAVSHLHYLAHKCAKYCCKHCLWDQRRVNAYLFICFWHIELWSICCSCHIELRCISVHMPLTYRASINMLLMPYWASMNICSYASDISSFDQYAAHAISFWMISWSGNGVTSLTVLLLFCSHISNTVLSLPLFFGTHNIGTT